jgi:chromosome segregation ATPase
MALSIAIFLISHFNLPWWYYPVAILIAFIEWDFFYGKLLIKHSLDSAFKVQTWQIAEVEGRVAKRIDELSRELQRLENSIAVLSEKVAPTKHSLKIWSKTSEEIKEENEQYEKHRQELLAAFEKRRSAAAAESLERRRSEREDIRKSIDIYQGELFSGSNVQINQSRIDNLRKELILLDAEIGAIEFAVSTGDWTEEALRYIDEAKLK